jgi:hypothetical protein
MGKFTSAVEGPLLIAAEALLTRGQEHVLRLLGRPVPAPVPVRLVIDTGSKRSSLAPSVIDRLQPAVQGGTRVETALASGRTNLFWVRLEFPGTSLAAVEELMVASLGLPPALRSFHGVIGRDLLSRWECFRYEGRLGRFTIRDTRPSLLGWLIR